MKHTDETLQAAIDAAMIEIGRQITGNNFAASLDYEASWPAEQSDRLALAKAFLAKLPEAQSIFAAVRGEAVGINGLTEAEEAKTASVAGLSKPDSTDWKVRAKKAEAELAALKGDMLIAERAVDNVLKILPEMVKSPSWEDAAITVREHIDKLQKELTELAALKPSQIGILRPLSEAGPVPDGCVRVTALKNYEDEWAIGDSLSRRDTHFADLRLPSTETPAVTEQPKQQVPLGPEDVMPGSVFRSSDEHWFQASHRSPNTVSLMAFGTSPRSISFKELEEENWQINRSIPLTGKWDANAWEPCYKLI